MLSENLGDLLRKNALLAKQELHSHLPALQIYPAEDGQGRYYFAEGTWDLMGNASVGAILEQSAPGGLVAGIAML
jgi:hypothetical protein